MVLTKFGQEMVESYRALEREFTKLAARRLNRQGAAVRRHSAAKSAAVRRPLARGAARR